MSQKGRAIPATTLEKKRLKYENKANRQYLIPEILDIHPIPGKDFFLVEIDDYVAQKVELISCKS